MQNDSVPMNMGSDGAWLRIWLTRDSLTSSTWPTVTGPAGIEARIPPPLVMAICGRWLKR